MKLKFTHPEPTENDIVGPKYWKSLEEVAGTPEFKEWLEREFPSGASELEGVNRRHFLRIMAASFSLAGLGLAACRQDEQHMLPYAKQPERNVPGVPLYYATSMPTPRGNLPLIIETHTSRPTKIEGNPSDPLYGGATDTYAQASILDLYDPDRMEKSSGPNKKTLSKPEVYDLLKKLHDTYKEKSGKGLAFLSEKSTSPTRDKLIGELKKEFPDMIWAEYEPIDHDNPLKALETVFKKPLRPLAHFENAKRVLSLDADFLNGECGYLAYARGFAKTRRVKDASQADQMSRLYVAESNFSLTGGMADHRLRLGTTQIPTFTCLVAAEVFRQAGGDAALIELLEEKGKNLNVDKKWIQECVKDLVAHKGESLIVAGSHLPEFIHLLVVALNAQLEANGKTITYVEVPKAKAQSISELAEAIRNGNINTLVIVGGNPAYNAPGDLDWPSLQQKVSEVIRYGYHFDETSVLAHTNIAATHYLESWSDGRTWEGAYVPVQPMILPLFEGLSELELLSHIAGKENPDPYALVKETFTELYPKHSFDEWLGVGIIRDKRYPATDITFELGKLKEALKQVTLTASALSAQNLEIRFLPSSHAYDGRYNNNGWLQELPDPMTRLTWDNAIIISPQLATELSQQFDIDLVPRPSLMNDLGQLELSSADFKKGKESAYIGEITANGKTVRGPIHIQLGLADYTVVLPLGFGRKEVGRVGKGTGFDAYPLLVSNNLAVLSNATLKVTHDRYLLANTQEHWSMEGRAIIREANVSTYQAQPDFVKKMGLESHAPPVYGSAKNDPVQALSKNIPRGGSLYKTPEFGGSQQWGMAIDLNTCIGCGACVVACQSENNIAIVGKEQVLRGREMHWIRIDRYFSSAQEDTTTLPHDPQVSFMSLMCQHCELAPCENVCPVNATVHDTEGLNVMAYNRCIGTRFCANNCPYKVRRFNFFDWNKRHIGHFYEGPFGPAGVEELHRMQKNPDVTLRMRGVMEKCTFCVQRIEEAKINQRVKAKDSDNVLVPDGTIQTACQQVCPTSAIVFGDILDAQSAVAQLKSSDRNYSVLGYLNTRPRTTYLGRIRNPNSLMPDYQSQPLSRLEYETRYGHGTHHDEADHSEETDPSHAV